MTKYLLPIQEKPSRSNESTNIVFSYFKLRCSWTNETTTNRQTSKNLTKGEHPQSDQVEKHTRSWGDSIEPSYAKASTPDPRLHWSHPIPPAERGLWLFVTLKPHKKIKLQQHHAPKSQSTITWIQLHNIQSYLACCAGLFGGIWLTGTLGNRPNRKLLIVPKSPSCQMWNASLSTLVRFNSSSCDWTTSIFARMPSLSSYMRPPDSHKIWIRQP